MEFGASVSLPAIKPSHSSNNKRMFYSFTYLGREWTFALAFASFTSHSLNLLNFFKITNQLAKTHANIFCRTALHLYIWLILSFSTGTWLDLLKYVFSIHFQNSFSNVHSLVFTCYKKGIVFFIFVSVCSLQDLSG